MKEAQAKKILENYSVYCLECGTIFNNLKKYENRTTCEECGSDKLYDITHHRGNIHLMGKH